MTPAPAQRVRLRQAFLLAWRLHRWLGLGFAAVIIVVSLTGGLLVMNAEIERLVERRIQVIAAPADPAAPRAAAEDIVRHLARLAPDGFRPLRLEPGKSPDRTDKYVFISDDGANRRWSAYANPYTGELVWHGPDQSLLRPWLLHLHEYLHAGTVGYLVVALSSVALLLLGLTGVWITRDRWRLLLRNPFRRRSASSRLVFADIHKWLGLASLYFSVVLGGTGLWFSVLTVPGLFSADARQPLAPPFDLSRLTSVSAAVAAARATFPDAEIARVIFPWDDGVGLQIRVLHRDAPVWLKMSRMDFDPITGDVRRIRRAADASPAEKLNSILGPLHFGYYGSPVVKWLYVLGGFSPAALALTGLVVRWKRRSRTASPL